MIQGNRPSSNANDVVRIDTSSGTVKSVPGGTIQFGFDHNTGSYEREGNSLVVTMADGSKLVVEDYFAVGKKSLPDFVLQDGTEIDGAELLARLNPDMDLKTAAGPAAAAPAGRAGAYDADFGNMVDGVDRSGTLGTIFWGGDGNWEITGQHEEGLPTGTFSFSVMSLGVGSPDGQFGMSPGIFENWTPHANVGNYTESPAEFAINFTPSSNEWVQEIRISVPEGVVLYRDPSGTNPWNKNASGEYVLDRNDFENGKIYIKAPEGSDTDIPVGITATITNSTGATTVITTGGTIVVDAVAQLGDINDDLARTIGLETQTGTSTPLDESGKDSGNYRSGELAKITINVEAEFGDYKDGSERHYVEVRDIPNDWILHPTEDFLLKDQPYTVVDNGDGTKNIIFDVTDYVATHNGEIDSTIIFDPQDWTDERLNNGDPNPNGPATIQVVAVAVETPDDGELHTSNNRSERPSEPIHVSVTEDKPTFDGSVSIPLVAEEDFGRDAPELNWADLKGTAEGVIKPVFGDDPLSITQNTTTFNLYSDGVGDTGPERDVNKVDLTWDMDKLPDLYGKLNTDPDYTKIVFTHDPNDPNLLIGTLGPNGPVALVGHVNPNFADGTVDITFVQYTAVKNANTDGQPGNDPTEGKFGIVLTDDDGDQIRPDIIYQVVDSTPVCTGVTPDAIVVQENEPGAGSNVIASGTSSIPNLNLKTFGADGLAAENALSIDDAALEAKMAADGIVTVDGKAVEIESSYDSENNVLTIRGFNANGDVFKLEVNLNTAMDGDSSYTYEQYQALHHDLETGSKATNSRDLLDLFGTDGVKIILTDADGSTDDIALKVTVYDDMPEPNWGSKTQHLHEALDTDSDNSTISSFTSAAGALFGEDSAKPGSFFGADGPADNNAVKVTLTGTHDFKTVDGDPVTVAVSEDGLTITGKLADGTDVFSLSVDPTDGSYTFNQYIPLYNEPTYSGDPSDPANFTGNKPLDLNFKVTVTDGDGDTATSPFTLQIRDNGDPGDPGDPHFPDPKDPDGPGDPDGSKIILVAGDAAREQEGGEYIATTSGKLTNLDEAAGFDGISKTTPFLVTLADLEAALANTQAIDANGNLIAISGLSVDCTDGVKISTNAFELTISRTPNADGDYTYEYKQKMPLKHLGDDQKDTLDIFGENGLNVTVVDKDGTPSKTPFGFGIQVIDDIPMSDNDPATDDNRWTDDLTGGGKESKTFTLTGHLFEDADGNPLNPDNDASIFGADGRNAVDNGLTINDDPTSNIEGLTFTGMGSNVITGMMDGKAVFTVTISKDGTYTYKQIAPITNAGDEAMKLNFKVTVTDGDGDKIASAPFELTIEDSLPDTSKIEIDPTADAVEDEKTANVADGAGIIKGLGYNNVDADGNKGAFGFDGAHAQNPLLATAAQLSEALDGLHTTAGQEVSVKAEPTMKNGKLEIVGVDEDGAKVFTLTIDPATGDYVYTQHQALKHPDGDGANKLDLFGEKGATITVQDADGSKADFKFNLSVTDDDKVDPVWTKPEEMAVGRENTDKLADGATTVVGLSGVLFVDDKVVFGADKANGTILIDTVSGVEGDTDGGNWLTHDGKSVTFSVENQGGKSIITGYVDVDGDGQFSAGDSKVCDLTLNIDGTYSYKQFVALHNPLEGGENKDLLLNFKVSVIDGDGDKAFNTFTLHIQDDDIDTSKIYICPAGETIAFEKEGLWNKTDGDHIARVEGDIRGIVDGQKGLATGADGLAEIPLSVDPDKFEQALRDAGVTLHDGTLLADSATVSVGPNNAIVLTTDAFTLTIYQNGHYKYVQTEPIKHPLNDNADIVTLFGKDGKGLPITLTDKDGTTAEFDLFQITVVDDTPMGSTTYNETTGKYSTTVQDLWNPNRFADGDANEGNVNAGVGEEFVGSIVTGKLFADTYKDPNNPSRNLDVYEDDGEGNLSVASVIFGADGANAKFNGLTVSAASDNIDGVTLNGVGTNVINGTNAAGELIFTLTINKDGTYTYEQKGAIPGGKDLELDFTVTVTDGDGDKVSQDFTLTIEDSKPDNPDDPKNPWSVKADADGAAIENEGAITASGHGMVNGLNTAAFGTDGMHGSNPLEVSSADLNAALANTKTINGESITATSKMDNGKLVITAKDASGDDAFTITIDPATGKYTYTQNQALKHEDGKDANQLNLFGDNGVAITVRDGDGSTVKFKFNIDVTDDMPNVDWKASPEIAEGQSSYTGTLFTGAGEGGDIYGADGEKVGGGMVITQSGNTGWQTIDGHAVTVSVSGNQIIGTANGSPAFILTVNADGSYKFEAIQPLANNAGDLELKFNVALTDKDLDTIDNDFILTIKDSGPDTDTWNVSPDADGKATENEGAITASGHGVVNGLNTAAYGADGLHADNPLEAAAADLNAALANTKTIGGESVSATAKMDGGKLVITGKDASGDAVFTITIDPKDGKYTYTQNQALKHADGNEANTLDLFGDNGVAITVRDGDGSTAQFKFNITVKDDIPNVDWKADPSITEGQDTYSGVLFTGAGAGGDIYGADGEKAGGGMAVSIDRADFAGWKTADGHNVTVQVIGNKVIGTANGSEAFTLTVNPDGTYKFEPKQGLDNGAGDLKLKFNVALTDGDLDTINHGFSLTIKDSGPDTKTWNVSPDADGGATENEGAITASGHGVVNGLNTAAYGDDGLHASNPLEAATADLNAALANTKTIGGESVSASAKMDGGKLVITGKDASGDAVFTITIDPKDGKYTYTQNQALKHADGDDANTLNLFGANGVAITVRDGDGSTAQFKFNITVTDDIPSVNWTPNTDADLNITEGAGVYNGTLFEGAGANGDIFGADGEKAGGGMVVTLGTNAAITTASGDAVSLSVNGNVITGSVGSVPAFKLTVNADGTYKFEQFMPLDNADADVKLNFNVALTDADLDTINHGFTLTIADSEGPNPDAITVTGDQTASEEEGASFISSDSGKLNGLDAAAGYSGLADKPFAVDPADLNNAINGIKTLDGKQITATATVANDGTLTVTGKNAAGADVFKLIIETDGDYKFEQYKPLQHGVIGKDDSDDVLKLFGENGLPISLIDKEGKSEKFNFKMNIEDDMPEVNWGAPTDITEGSNANGIYTGTLFEGAGVGGDIYGADGPKAGGGMAVTLGDNEVISTADGDIVRLSVTGNEIFGKVGNDVVFKLTVNADGTYKFEQIGALSNAKEDVHLNFNVALTDGDGDTITKGFTLNIADSDGPNPNVITVTGDQTASEEEGNAFISSDSGKLNGLEDAVGYSGLADQPFDVDQTDLNNAINGVKTLDGKQITATADSDGNGTLTITGKNAAGEEVFKLTIEKDGDYKFEQYKPLQHGVTGKDDGDDVLNLFGASGLPISLIDKEGKSEKFNFTMKIEDDMPDVKWGTANDFVEGAGSATGTLFTGLGANGDIYGADGPKAGGGMAVSLGTNDEIKTADGAPVELIVEGNVIYGRLVGATTNAFKLTVNADGSYKFEQFEALDNAAKDVKINFGVALTDGDGDTLNHGFTLTIKDSAGPDTDKITVSGDQTASEEEGNLASISSDTGKLNGLEAAAGYSGLNDKPFAVDPADLNNAINGIKTLDGQQITATSNVADNGTLTVTGKNAGGETVFTLTIAADGDYTFLQFKPLQHSGIGKDDGADVLQLFGANGLPISLIDKEGKSEKFNFKMNIEDDMPKVDWGRTADVAEGGTANGTLFTGLGVNGDIYGADGAKAGGGLAVTLGDNSGWKTADGQPVTIAVENGNIVGRIPTGGEAFKLTINPDGTYSFKSTLPLANNGSPLPLKFKITLTDGDNDSVSNDFTLNITDSSKPDAGRIQVEGSTLVKEEGGSADIAHTSGKLNTSSPTVGGFDGLADKPFVITQADVTSALNGVKLLDGSQVTATVSVDPATGTITITSNAFVLTLDKSGNYDYTQKLPLQHSVSGKEGADDVLKLFGNGLNINVTDKDGTVSTNPFKFNITVQDDMPHADWSEPVSQTGTEGAKAADGSYLTLTGNAGALFSGLDIGADGFKGGSATAGGIQVVMSGDLGWKTVDGHAITTSTSGNVITGMANGKPAFTLTVNADGSYTYKQFVNLDPQGQEFSSLKFDINIVDGDGDIIRSIDNLGGKHHEIKIDGLITVSLEHGAETLYESDSPTTFWNFKFARGANEMTEGNLPGDLEVSINLHDGGTATLGADYKFDLDAFNANKPAGVSVVSYNEGTGVLTLKFDAGFDVSKLGDAKLPITVIDDYATENYFGKSGDAEAVIAGLGLTSKGDGVYEFDASKLAALKGALQQYGDNTWDSQPAKQGKENISVGLTDVSGTGYEKGSEAANQDANIVDNDYNHFTVSIEGVGQDVREGDDVFFKVSISGNGNTTQDTIVILQIDGGSATNGEDYTSAGQYVVVIPAGQKEALIKIPTTTAGVDNVTAQAPYETINMKVLSTHGNESTIGNGNAEMRIVEPAGVQVWLDDVSKNLVTEGTDASIQYVLAFSGEPKAGSVGYIFVSFEGEDSTAIFGVDYYPQQSYDVASGKYVNYTPGGDNPAFTDANGNRGIWIKYDPASIDDSSKKMTFNVTIVNDDIVEGKELFSAKITHVDVESGDYVGYAAKNAGKVVNGVIDVNIVDNDTAIIRITHESLTAPGAAGSSSATFAEPNMGTDDSTQYTTVNYLVSIDKPLGAPLSVTVNIGNTGNTATMGSDYDLGNLKVGSDLTVYFKDGTTGTVKITGMADNATGGKSITFDLPETVDGKQATGVQLPVRVASDKLIEGNEGLTATLTANVTPDSPKATVGGNTASTTITDTFQAVLEVGTYNVATGQWEWAKASTVNESNPDVCYRITLTDVHGHPVTIADGKTITANVGVSTYNGTHGTTDNGVSDFNLGSKTVTFGADGKAYFGGSANGHDLPEGARYTGGVMQIFDDKVNNIDGNGNSTDTASFTLNVTGISAGGTVTGGGVNVTVTDDVNGQGNPDGPSVNINLVDTNGGNLYVGDTIAFKFDIKLANNAGYTAQEDITIEFKLPGVDPASLNLKGATYNPSTGTYKITIPGGTNDGGQIDFASLKSLPEGTIKPEIVRAYGNEVGKVTANGIDGTDNPKLTLTSEAGLSANSYNESNAQHSKYDYPSTEAVKGNVANYTLHLDKPYTDSVDVTMTISAPGGTGFASAADFMLKAGTDGIKSVTVNGNGTITLVVTVPAGAKDVNFGLQLKDDAFDEGVEKFNVSITGVNKSDVVVGGQKTVETSIIDDRTAEESTGKALLDGPRAILVASKTEVTEPLTDWADGKTGKEATDAFLNAFSGAQTTAKSREDHALYEGDKDANGNKILFTDPSVAVFTVGLKDVDSDNYIKGVEDTVFTLKVSDINQFCGVLLPVPTNGIEAVYDAEKQEIRVKVPAGMSAAQIGLIVNPDHNTETSGADSGVKVWVDSVHGNEAVVVDTEAGISISDEKAHGNYDQDAVNRDDVYWKVDGKTTNPETGEKYKWDDEGAEAWQKVPGGQDRPITLASGTGGPRVFLGFNLDDSTQDESFKGEVCSYTHRVGGQNAQIMKLAEVDEVVRVYKNEAGEYVTNGPLNGPEDYNKVTYTVGLTEAADQDVTIKLLVNLTFKGKPGDFDSADFVNFNQMLGFSGGTFDSEAGTYTWANGDSFDYATGIFTIIVEAGKTSENLEMYIGNMPGVLDTRVTMQLVETGGGESQIDTRNALTSLLVHNKDASGGIIEPHRVSVSMLNNTGEKFVEMWRDNDPAKHTQIIEDNMNPNLGQEIPTLAGFIQFQFETSYHKGANNTTAEPNSVTASFTIRGLDGLELNDDFTQAIKVTGVTGECIKNVHDNGDGTWTLTIKYNPQTNSGDGQRVTVQVPLVEDWKDERGESVSVTLDSAWVNTPGSYNETGVDANFVDTITTNTYLVEDGDKSGDAVSIGLLKNGSIVDGTEVNVVEEDGVIIYRIYLHDKDGNITVAKDDVKINLDYEAADGTISGKDFIPLNYQATIEKGQSWVDVKVPVFKNTEYNPTAGFTVKIDGVWGAESWKDNDSNSVETILVDQDKPKLVIGNNAPANGVYEGNDVTFTINVKTPDGTGAMKVGKDMVVRFTLDDDGAADWLLQSGATKNADGSYSLTIPAGSTSANIVFKAIQDGVMEGKEPFNLHVLDVSVGLSGGGSRVIIDGSDVAMDSPASIAADRMTANLTANGTTTFTEGSGAELSLKISLVDPNTGKATTNNGPTKLVLNVNENDYDLTKLSGDSNVQSITRYGNNKIEVVLKAGATSADIKLGIGNNDLVQGYRNNSAITVDSASSSTPLDGGGTTPVGAGTGFNTIFYDNDLPKITFSGAGGTVAEGGNINFNLNLDKGLLAGTTYVYLNVAGISQTDLDISGDSRLSWNSASVLRIALPAGTAAGDYTFTLKAATDGRVEGTENLTLSWNSASVNGIALSGTNATGSGGTAATYSITDGDSAVAEISSTATSVNEGAYAPLVINFGKPVDQPVTVVLRYSGNIDAADFTAIGTNYTVDTTNKTITIVVPANNGSYNAGNIRFLADGNPEGNETMGLSIQSVTAGNNANVTAGTSTVNWTVVDGDTPTATLGNMASVSEGANISIPLNFGAVGSKLVGETTVVFKLASGSVMDINDLDLSKFAANGLSYNSTTGEITFKFTGAAPSSIQLPTRVDGALEGPETFQLELVKASNENSGSMNVSGAKASGKLYDGDAGEMTLTFTNAEYTEGGKAVVSVNRGNATANGEQIRFTVQVTASQVDTAWAQSQGWQKVGNNWVGDVIMAAGATTFDLQLSNDWKTTGDRPLEISVTDVHQGHIDFNANKATATVHDDDKAYQTVDDNMHFFVQVDASQSPIMGTMTGPGAFDILANDLDKQAGEPITVTGGGRISDLGRHGDLAIGSDGKATYTVDESTFTKLAAGGQFTDAYKYSVTDGDHTSTAKVNVVFHGVENAWTSGDDNITAELQSHDYSFFGGAGNDKITVFTGNHNQVWGGSGTDTFVWQRAGMQQSGQGHDTIGDFSLFGNEKDKINISDILDSGATDQNLNNYLNISFNTARREAEIKISSNGQVDTESSVNQVITVQFADPEISGMTEDEVVAALMRQITHN